MQRELTEKSLWLTSNYTIKQTIKEDKIHNLIKYSKFVFDLIVFRICEAKTVCTIEIKAG